MLMADPHHVRALLARYASARIALAEKDEPSWQRALEDVTHALCEATGTRSIADALPAADSLLARPVQPRRPLVPEGAPCSTDTSGAGLAA
ncbi:DUF5133 domain-containing protein [Streptomyces sp. SP18CS02]|uniref:DUF5133 domain-containing protein n=1 Tax=Streptomyces sp. SP18CS02 TaxID=3002531 RepID=UPI002E77D7A6|nr:DUF5133 domain-containing protein [Streptomyces sp. SP18CS02]MEE1752828.1 DUF5133 domain-containing protein [Streptomyces sp. SP18CS02]